MSSSSRSTPQHPLWRVQAGIEKARIYTTSARRPVASKLGLSDREADAYIRKLVARLAPHDFCRTVEMRNGGELADEYAVRNSDGAWYVKVFVEDGTHVVSCHPPEWPMTTARGERIP